MTSRPRDPIAIPGIRDSRVRVFGSYVTTQQHVKMSSRVQTILIRETSHTQLQPAVPSEYFCARTERRRKLYSASSSVVDCRARYSEYLLHRSVQSTFASPGLYIHAQVTTYFTQVWFASFAPALREQRSAGLLSAASAAVSWLLFSHPLSQSASFHASSLE